jgi:hypothetical protein
MSIDCVVLGEDQQLELSRIAQSRSLPAGYVFRSRLILMLAEGASFSTIKAEVSAVSVVLHPGTNCISPDTSRMVLDAPSNQGAHQGNVLLRRKLNNMMSNRKVWNLAWRELTAFDDQAPPSKSGARQQRSR